MKEPKQLPPDGPLSAISLAKLLYGAPLRDAPKPMKETKRLLTVNEIARRLGVAPHQASYAVRSAKLEPVGQAGKSRVFSEDDLGRVKAVIDRVKEEKAEKAKQRAEKAKSEAEAKKRPTPMNDYEHRKVAGTIAKEWREIAKKAQDVGAQIRQLMVACNDCSDVEGAYEARVLEVTEIVMRGLCTRALRNASVAQADSNL